MHDMALRSPSESPSDGTTSMPAVTARTEASTSASRSLRLLDIVGPKGLVARSAISIEATASRAPGVPVATRWSALPQKQTCRVRRDGLRRRRVGESGEGGARRGEAKRHKNPCEGGATGRDVRAERKRGAGWRVVWERGGGKAPAASRPRAC